MNNTSTLNKSNFILLSKPFENRYRIVYSNGRLVEEFNSTSIQEAVALFEQFKITFKEPYYVDISSDIAYKKNTLVVHSLVKRIFFSVCSYPLRLEEHYYYEIKINGTTIKTFFSIETDQEAFIQYNDIIKEYLLKENEPTEDTENPNVYFLIA